MGVRASALCFALFTSELNALVAAMPKQSARPKNKGNGALSVFSIKKNEHTHTQNPVVEWLMEIYVFVMVFGIQ